MKNILAADTYGFGAFRVLTLFFKRLNNPENLFFLSIALDQTTDYKGTSLFLCLFLHKGGIFSL